MIILTLWRQTLHTRNGVDEYPTVEYDVKLLLTASYNRNLKISKAPLKSQAREGSSQLIHDRSNESKRGFPKGVKRSSGPISRIPGGDRGGTEKRTEEGTEEGTEGTEEGQRGQKRGQRKGQSRNRRHSQFHLQCTCFIIVALETGVLRRLAVVCTKSLPSAIIRDQLLIDSRRF